MTRCSHVDKPIRRGGVQCTVCGDRFPCKADCGHIDCRMERREPLPPHIHVHGYTPTRSLWCPECGATIRPPGFECDCDD